MSMDLAAYPTTGDERGTVATCVCQQRYDEGPIVLEGLLDEVIESLTRVRETVPAEYRASAKCSITSDYEGPIEVEINYERPETNEEWENRLAHLRSRAKVAKANQEARERILLAALKAKYES